MDSHTASTVDVSAFRKAMGSFPTGATVVTVACGDGSVHGVTVNSFSSVSLDPMLVLICLNETSRAVSLIERAGAFGVNVLSAAQRELSRWFANRRRPAGVMMFGGVPLEPGVTGCPVLAGAVASFDCQLRGSYRAGDHLIVLGEVAALIHRPHLEPLIFHAGTYKSLEHGALSRLSDGPPMDGDPTDEFLRAASLYVVLSRGHAGKDGGHAYPIGWPAWPGPGRTRRPGRA